jgi:hypothetical protein
MDVGVMKLHNYEEFYSYLYIRAHICGSCIWKAAMGFQFDPLYELLG